MQGEAASGRMARLKVGALHELQLTLVFFAYLAICFGVVTFHAWAETGEHGAIWHLMLVAMTKAWVVSKLVSMGHKFNVGQAAPHRPLWVRALLRAFGLTGVVAIMTPVEELVFGVLRGEPVMQEVASWAVLDPLVVISRLLLVLLLLYPPAFVVELMRDMTAGEFRRLVFEVRRDPALQASGKETR